MLIAAAAGVGAPWELQAVQSATVSAPRKIKDVKPVYPEQSLAAGDEGVVIAELDVDASGAVTAARVLWSKCPALNDSALKATRSWRFEQWRVNGGQTVWTGGCRLRSIQVA